MKKQLVFYVIILLSTVSCKKENDKISPIYNKWTVVSGGGAFVYGGNLKYIIVEPDNTFYLLYEYNYGIRGFEEGLCQVINGQISFYKDYYFNLFNLKIDGNNLTLTNPDIEIVCERNGDEPSKPEWVQTAEILQSMDAPVEARTDLAFDGEFLWCGGFVSYDDPAYLYKIDPATLSVVQNLPTSNWPIGIEWADGYLWVSSNGYESIIKVNPVNGSNLFTSVEMGAWINGIAFDGQYLWCGSNNAQIVYKYNPNSDAIAATFQIGSLGGMAYVQDYLYICANGILNKCTVDPLQAVAAYDIEKGDIQGIAYDGSNFWISADISDETPNYKIYKVSW